jgi:hypothetical protein
MFSEPDLKWGTMIEVHSTDVVYISPREMKIIAFQNIVHHLPPIHNSIMVSVRSKYSPNAQRMFLTNAFRFLSVYRRQKMCRA